MRASRPLFLIVGLCITMFFGMAGWMSGCQTIQEYRSQEDAFTTEVDALPQAEDRALARAELERYAAVMDANKKREFPLGAAELILGAAMLTFTARAFAGRKSARGLLVQVALAQAALLVAEHFMTADVRDALVSKMGLIMCLKSPPDSVQRLLFRPEVIARVASAGMTTWLFVRTLMSALAAFFLTRRPSVEFFESLQA